MSDINTVKAKLYFYAPPEDGSKPEFHVTHPSGSGTKNYNHNEVEVTIQDIRSHGSSFSLEQNSFQTIQNKLPPNVNFDNPAEVQQSYYPLIVELILKHVKDLNEVIIFDHCIRKVTNDLTKQRPVNKVHIDQTPKAALQRYQQHVPSAIKVKFEGQRIRLINLWRPIKGPILDYHLAVGDSRTLKKEDLVEIAHVFPDRVGETFGVKFREGQQFWYLREMGVDEVLLLQCFDSADEKNCCAHASFRDPGMVGKGEVRESIEVRCLILG